MAGRPHSSKKTRRQAVKEFSPDSNSFHGAEKIKTETGVNRLHTKQYQCLRSEISGLASRTLRKTRTSCVVQSDHADHQSVLQKKRLKPKSSFSRTRSFPGTRAGTRSSCVFARLMQQRPLLPRDLCTVQCLFTSTNRRATRARPLFPACGDEARRQNPQSTATWGK